MKPASPLLVALCAAGAFALPAAAAEWAPAKPVRMIVGFPPGGANGVISNELIMRADPDGQTIGFGHIGTLVISPVITKVPYDVHR